jgi:hypothetical protein
MKEFKILADTSSYQLMKTVNQLGIQQEDIVSLLYIQEQFMLFYYG